MRPSPPGGLHRPAGSQSPSPVVRMRRSTRPRIPHLAPGAGFGRGGRSDASAIPSCAWITARLGSLLGYCDHGTAARAAREAGLGEGSGARRKGWQLLQKPYIRAAIAARSAAVLNHAHQRARGRWRERRHSPADAELDRLARLELTALLKIEEAERRQRILMRLHHEAGGRHRVGSQGGAQSRFARVCRQYFGEPAHREPGRCCCGQPATSPRGASCDYCRERNRYYRRRYRAKVRRLRAV